MEQDGLIFREVYGQKPPIKVIYGLTDFGRSCIPLLNSILAWGNQVAEQRGQFINK